MMLPACPARTFEERFCRRGGNCSAPQMLRVIGTLENLRAVRFSNCFSRPAWGTSAFYFFARLQLQPAEGRTSHTCSRERDALGAAPAVVAEKQRRSSGACCRGLERHTDRTVGACCQSAATSSGCGEICAVAQDGNLPQVHCHATLIRERYCLRGAARAYRLTGKAETRWR